MRTHDGLPSNRIITPCGHTGVIRIASIGDSEIFAGTASAVERQYTSFDLFVSLNNDVPESPIRLVNGNNIEYSTIARYSQSKPVLLIDWFDYRAPPLRADFFFDLFEDIKSGPARKIAVFCTGGHGRTGTFCALLLSWLKTEHPVVTLRKMYCNKAVESQTQLDFLANAGVDVTGIHIEPQFGSGSLWKDKHAKGPACSHPACPWAYCLQRKQGKKGKKALPRKKRGTLFGTKQP